MSLHLLVVPLVLVASYGFATTRSGLAHANNSNNQALLVGASHGLPGIVQDVDHVEEILKRASYNYSVTTLEEEQASKAAVVEALGDVAEKAGVDGSFFFYFSGHGASGTGALLMDDSGLLKPTELRAAIEAGRAAVGPLKRLVIMSDSCFSGHLLDPMRHTFAMNAMLEKEQAAQAVEALVQELSPRRGAGYWESLFVFASSLKTETSLAGQTGSVFTNALQKAYLEVAQGHGTVGNLVTKTQEYTKGHHPIARLVPDALAQESLE